jgi:peptide chain release factor 1
LHTTHIGGKCGLITDGGGDTTEQCRYFGTSLGESENVVDEQEHILTFFVTLKQNKDMSVEFGQRALKH